jgi:ribosomal protein S18 acetylase RimI-like enzyme
MIRAATLADLDFLVHGNASMARETESIELDRETLREGVRAVLTGEKPGAYRILELDGRPIAQLMITYEWSDWRNRMVWWIQSVFVEPDLRGRGHFRALYESVIEEARREGAGGVRLYVEEHNTRAQKVYEALGMQSGRYRVFEKMFSEY